MRKLIRRATHVLMFLLLVLGICCLIAWPASIYYRSVFVDHVLEIPTPWIKLNPQEGAWKRDFQLYAYVSYGWVSFDLYPNHIHAFWDGPDELVALWKEGYHQNEYLDAVKGADRTWLDWHEPIDYDTEWNFEYHTHPSLYFTAQLWALAAVSLLISIPWFYFTLKRVFVRRLRVQTNLCLHCGYNLTGVESDKCPECGADRPMATVSATTG